MRLMEEGALIAGTGKEKLSVNFGRQKPRMRMDLPFGREAAVAAQAEAKRLKLELLVMKLAEFQGSSRRKYQKQDVQRRAAEDD